MLFAAEPAGLREDAAAGTDFVLHQFRFEGGGRDGVSVRIAYYRYPA
jgi:hypothetical protein